MSIAEFPNNAGRARNNTAEFERTPPQDVIAEQSVLGGMLLSKDAISDVVEILRERDFYRPAHELIYDAIIDLYGRGEPADPVTVSAELTKRGDLVRAGGAPYLHTLISSVPTAASAGGNLPDEKKALLKALEDVQAMIGHMVGMAMSSQEDPKEIYKVGLNTSRLLMATGDLIIAWLLLRQADIAQSKLANAGRETEFYNGKIASAKFFVRSVLPHISVERAVVESENGEIMNISESAF